MLLIDIFPHHLPEPIKPSIAGDMIAFVVALCRSIKTFKKQLALLELDNCVLVGQEVQRIDRGRDIIQILDQPP